MFRKQDHQTKRILMSVAGVLICGVGVGLFKFAAFGVDPFQSLMAGLAAAIPISFGLLYILANLLLLLFSVVLDRSKIGLATIINLTLLGYVVDWSHKLLMSAFPNPGMAARIGVLIVGLGVLAFSCSLYFVANLGVSTYDAVALVASERWKRIPFRFFRIATDLVCVGLGLALFLLSGNPISEIGQVTGVGTIVTACCLGPLIEWCNIHISTPLLNGSRKTN